MPDFDRSTCPPGCTDDDPHAHFGEMKLPIVSPAIGELIAATMGGIGLPLDTRRSPVHMNDHIEVAGSFLMALQYIAALWVADLIGHERPKKIRMYHDIAVASVAKDWPAMTKGMDAMFQFLAAKNGVPMNPANALAATLAVVSEMSSIISEYTESYERGSEGEIV